MNHIWLDDCLTNLNVLLQDDFQGCGNTLPDLSDFLSQLTEDK